MLYSRLTGTESAEVLSHFEDVVLTMIRTTRLQHAENERLETSYKRFASVNYKHEHHVLSASTT